MLGMVMGIGMGWDRNEMGTWMGWDRMGWDE